jgi:hypothetical protein
MRGQHRDALPHVLGGEVGREPVSDELLDVHVVDVDQLPPGEVGPDVALEDPVVAAPGRRAVLDGCGPPAVGPMVEGVSA